MLEIIDTENFPCNIVDTETSIILDDLLLKRQLISRLVKYCIIYSNNHIQMTDLFDEYCYNNRKFIRYQQTTEKSNGEILFDEGYYWIEVKPIDYLEELDLQNEPSRGL